MMVAALAAVFLAVDWLYVGAVNSCRLIVVRSRNLNQAPDAVGGAKAADALRMRISVPLRSNETSSIS